MDILLENAHLLKFTFHLGCVYMGPDDKLQNEFANQSGYTDLSGQKYIIGCLVDEKGCGACGLFSRGICVSPYTTERLTGKSPDSIAMSIDFVNKDAKLYEDLRKMLYTFVDDEILIQYHGTPLVRKRLDLMEKFALDVEQITFKNTEIMRIYDEKVKVLDILLSEFEEMGCQIDDCNLGDPKLKSIPNEWYNYEESYDATKITISIMFHKQTRFYQTLKDIGFLGKFIPAALNI